ncbi:WUSCHEL related homeobox 12 [Striga asiatica]|uniref:Protein WUSCHEL n=1 Tax=Striga asiatica TaxID=4170 RepID=A0A5A7P4Z1_STRAF|nr:WUSCHEL related homeobox 12 [Striga asiatica]
MDDEGKQEPARSRWAPKPEQILILESIFNSGTVNPSKDETSRIRMLLQRYGPVADANVFYWFQNRRSRSRRNRLRAHDRATSTQNNNNNNNNINNSSFQCEDNFLPNTSAVVGPTSSFPLHTNILHYDHQYLLGGNYNYVNSENNASNYSYACSPHLNYEPGSKKFLNSEKQSNAAWSYIFIVT